VTLLRLLAPTLLAKVDKDFKQPATTNPVSAPDAKPNLPPSSSTGIN
jgi:hypothetical protein